MAIDIESLIAPVSDDAPSGPDLSYESERQQIEIAFERSVSSDAAADEDSSNWRETIDLILTQGKLTRDMWLPVYLMRAAAQSGNFAMVADGAEWLAGLLENRWDDVHPQLDEYGFIGRKTPCESLTRIGDFLAPLSRMALLEHQRLGRYSCSDFERFHKEGASADNYGMFRALLDATSEDDLRAVHDRLEGLESAIRRVDSVMTANADGDTATNFAPTYEALGKYRAAVASFVPGMSGAGGDAGGSAETYESAPSTSTGYASAPSGPGFSGGIASRDDVVRALDAIDAYYARHEPGSPVPFALRRARQWISLDFMAVLEDIAPGSLEEASRVLKSGRESSGGWDSGGDTGSSSTSSDDGGW